MPRGAPRAMNMVMDFPSRGPMARMGPTWLAARSCMVWGREPEEECDLESCRHQGWEAEHAT
jgi:hypothetical protein